VATAFAVGLIWTLSLAALFAGAVSDFRQRLIPNGLVALTAGCGIVLRLLANPHSVGVSLVVAVCLLLLMGLMARRQWLGGGDAKMIAAATLLVPPGEIAGMLLAIMVCGGLLSCIYLYVQSASRTTALVAVDAGLGANLASPLEPPHADVQDIADAHSIPYGVAIFAGVASLAIKQAAWWYYAIS
jgi:prepilin peptidase CpaA